MCGRVVQVPGVMESWLLELDEIVAVFLRLVSFCCIYELHMCIPCMCSVYPFSCRLLEKIVLNGFIIANVDIKMV